MENKGYIGKIFTFNTTWSHVSVRLVGEDGETKHTRIGGLLSFLHGKVRLISVSGLSPRPWFVRKVQVTCPEGKTYTFPVYTWIADDDIHRFREGTGLKVVDEHNLLAKYTRETELRSRKKIYCWEVYKEGLPHCMKADNACSLPCEVRFSFIKTMQFGLTAAVGLAEINLTYLKDCKENWPSFEEIDKIFLCSRYTTIDSKGQHWEEDAFFGYQFLNGVNPMLIRRCTSLPCNFPVTDEMVFLHGGASLVNEMKKGNIFLCDYKNLDGVRTNVINDKRQHLAAPLVLLHKTPENELKPIAIQLKQTPAEDNPIFFPTDAKYDWLLAKTFVRSADFNEHELNVHLLRTHLLAEVFTVSLLRNVPKVHPLFKLLIPHTRYTLQINLMARQTLISPHGVFTKSMITIMQRSLTSLTYSSLCLPEDIKERGVESVPNYYYRDDGLKLWDIIHRFVNGVLSCYYENDNDVQQDTELQKWIQDICEHGLLSQVGMGFPQRFLKKDELVKFVTMVIFTCSGQHAAVSNAQFDYGGWMPNTPISLQQPPPTRKGTATEETLLKTLPDVSVTVHGMAVLYLLSKQSSDFVALGQYPNEHFCEVGPSNAIKEFQRELEDLHETIGQRNKSSEIRLAYPYLDPKSVENSISL
uniref:Lipoxygenase domain-containing protein n=1 Tax=Neogobius melanostomus TaxID=47308 RepID=A0A8C6TF17_9GOBI